MKLSPTSGLGLVLIISLILFVFLQLSKPTVERNFGSWKGGEAKLPCLANNVCPSGQKCSGGFCSEGFMSPVNVPTDMSSCTAKECNGINAPCSRKASPCPEGTFCQGNQCININTTDQGEAYNQIGNILN
jgi:hypothetical protein